MSFQRIAENRIREAMENGEFDKLPHGRKIDLSQYFSLPEELRLVHSVLKNAGIIPGEIELLREIGGINTQLEQTEDLALQQRLKKQRAELQLKFDLLLEQRRKRPR
ncbi:MAG: DnaJ family domain-containing protein [Blastocatellia bacterium]